MNNNTPSEQQVRGNLNRAEHLAWCKERALEYVESGDLCQALSSMLSDLSKHDETRDWQASRPHANLELLDMMVWPRPQKVRDFIESFH